MLHILAGKIASNQLVILKDWGMEKPSSSLAYNGFAGIVQASPFNADYSKGRVLRAKTNDKRRTVTVIVDNDKKENKLSVRNIPWIKLLHVDRLATMPVFYNHGIIITDEAFKKITGKLG
jgi:ribosomal protein L4